MKTYYGIIARFPMDTDWALTEAQIDEALTAIQSRRSET